MCNFFSVQELTKYDEMFAKMQSGEISKDAWVEFCKPFFNRLMESPEVGTIMKRLKYR